MFVLCEFYKDFTAVAGIEGMSKDAVKAAVGANQNILQRAAAIAAEIFAPLIPAIITGGLILGCRSHINSLYIFEYGTKTLVELSQFLAGMDHFLWLIDEAVFHVGIPVRICWSVVRKMDSTPILGIVQISTALRWTNQRIANDSRLQYGYFYRLQYLEWKN